jgi:hypothetical protein
MARPLCVPRLDRLGFAADAVCIDGLKALGFQRDYHYFTKPERGYAEVSRLTKPETGTQIEISLCPRFGYLKQALLHLIANDATGLSHSETNQVLECGDFLHMNLVELALDFASGSGIDLAFVRRHLIAGKSQIHRLCSHPPMTYYGSKRSPKHLRCYQKERLNAFRVEFELRREWLRKRKIFHPDDLPRLPVLLDHSHFRFVRINWGAVRRRLDGMPRWSDLVFEMAEKMGSELHSVLAWLRAWGVTNVQEFLLPLNETQIATRAIRLWAKHWSESK